MNFKDFIFGLFPYYFKEQDTYKNQAGGGLFERFVKALGSEIDDNLYPFLQNFLDILDPTTCPDKFLPLISGNLGYLPSGGIDLPTYRRILSYAVSIYQTRGSKEGFDIFFSVLGYTIKIVESKPRRSSKYDSDPIYDDGWNYDQDCEYCSDFWIAIRPVEHEGDFIIPIELKNQVLSIMPFLAPINAKYRGLIKLAQMEDIFITDITETITP